MGPPYMWSVIDRNVVMWRISVPLPAMWGCFMPQWQRSHSAYSTQYFMWELRVCGGGWRWSVVIELCSVHNMYLISTKEHVSHAGEEACLCIFHMFHGISWAMAVEWVRCL